MASSFTSNKNLEKPGNNDYIDTWNVPVNANYDAIDAALGGVTNLNVTGVSGSVTLTSSQYRALTLNITGTLTANVTYAIPASVGGQWVVRNATTGSHTVTIASVGGGASVVAAQGANTQIFSDGSNVRTTLPVIGLTTQVIYNLNGSLTGDANFTFDGTILSAPSIASATVSASGAITSGAAISDASGDVRDVPQNSRTTSYTLVASDNGKHVSTTAGVTVPASVFGIGDTVTIYNNSTSSITITQGAGVTLRLVATVVTGNRTLGQRGLATILCVANNEFVITGGGLT
jgi:hypothetical protein